MQLQKLIVICGPTASGKTKLAVETAIAYHGEVISADSMQIYRGMDIGTAKPTEQDKKGVPHHLVDCVNIDEEYSVALFQKQARQCIAEVAERGSVPILCGGTGLYINSVIYPLDFNVDKSDPLKKKELMDFAQAHGNGALYSRLVAQSPDIASTIHSNNVKRVIRALEIVESGKSNEMPQRLFN
jgi:tRNA dimethylallyltransferase